MATVSGATRRRKKRVGVEEGLQGRLQQTCDAAAYYRPLFTSCTYSGTNYDTEYKCTDRIIRVQMAVPPVQRTVHTVKCIGDSTVCN